MKFPDNFPKELNIYLDNMDHIDIKTINGGDTNLREFISRLLSSDQQNRKFRMV